MAKSSVNGTGVEARRFEGQLRLPTTSSSLFIGVMLWCANIGPMLAMARAAPASASMPATTVCVMKNSAGFNSLYESQKASSCSLSTFRRRPRPYGPPRSHS